MKISNKPKVGLLALTLELYETLAPTLRENREGWVRRSVLPVLDQEFDVLFHQAVFTTEGIEKELQQFEKEGACAVIILFLCYSPSQVSLPALKKTRLPILIWNTQELWAVDSSFTGQNMSNNHGVHGTHDLGNVLSRCNIPFEIVTSHLDDPDPLEEMRDFMIAAETRKSLQGANFALLGYPFPGMGDFAVDVTQLVAQFGTSYGNLPLEEYIQRAENASKEDVLAIVNEYRDWYNVAPDLTDVDLEWAARVEIAFRQMIQTRNLTGLTYQFTAFGEDERTPTIPFVAMSRLMGEGIGFGGEGDLVSTTGTTIFQRLSGAATFAEIFTTDFAGNGLLFSHMGEFNTAMARKDRKISLVGRSQIAKNRFRQLVLVGSLEPQWATFCTLTVSEDGWKIIMTTGEIDDFGPLAKMSAPHTKLKLKIDVRDFLSNYVRLGGPHHNALCFGDVRRRLVYFAKLMGIDLIEL